MQTRADLKPMLSDLRSYRRLSEPLPPEARDPLDAKDFLQVVRLVLRRFHFVLASVVVGVGLAALVAFYVMPIYTAKTLLVVGDGQLGDSRNSDDMSIDTQIAMLTSRAHLEQVLQSLWREPRLRRAIPRFRDLEKHLKVMQELKSRVIAVIYTAKSPIVAAEVANRVATLYVDGFAGRLQLFDEVTKHNAKQITALNDELQRAEAELGRTDERDGSKAGAVAGLGERIAELKQKLKNVKMDQSLVELREEDRKQLDAMSPPVRIFALATPPEAPSSIRPILVIVPAFLASAIFGIAIALVLGRLDRLFYKEADLAAAFDVPCLGGVPDTRRRHRGASILLPQSGSGRARAIDSVIASVLLVTTKKPKIILVTSSKMQEGKTNFAMSFAAVASRLHRRVILVDLDILRSVPAEPLSGKPGLFDVLAGESSMDDATRHAADLSLDILPIGTRNEDPLVALGSDRLTKEIDRLKARYDCIVINGPPVLGVTETRIIAGKADQIILVVRSRATKQDEASEALRQLSNSVSIGFAGSQTRIATVLTTPPLQRRYDIPWNRRAASKASAAAVKRATQEKAVIRPGADTLQDPKGVAVGASSGTNVDGKGSSDTQALAI